jgi:hypothetical protein
MVSTDHFRQELLAQMSRATVRGFAEVLITSGELCRSIQMGGAWSANSCDAMQEEMKPGDVLVLEKVNGAGMTVRYALPRAIERTHTR